MVPLCQKPCLLLLLVGAAALMAGAEDILITVSPPCPPRAHRRHPPLLAAASPAPMHCLARLFSLPVLQGGTVVNADRQFQADVLIRDGIILRVEPGLQVQTASLPAALVPSTHSGMQPIPMLLTPGLATHCSKRCRRHGRAHGSWMRAASW